jgi:hypothetical protein
LTLYCVKILKQDYTAQEIASIYNDLINFINTIFSDKTDEEKHKLLVAFVLSFNPSEGNNINKEKYINILKLIHNSSIFSKLKIQKNSPDDNSKLFNFEVSYYNNLYDNDVITLLTEWRKTVPKVPTELQQMFHQTYSIKGSNDDVNINFDNLHNKIETEDGVNPMRQGGKRVSRRRRRNRTKRRRRRHVSRRT